MFLSSVYCKLGSLTKREIIYIILYLQASYEALYSQYLSRDSGEATCSEPSAAAYDQIYESCTQAIMNDIMDSHQTNCSIM